MWQHGHLTSMRAILTMPPNVALHSTGTREFADKDISDTGSSPTVTTFDNGTNGSALVR